MKKILSIVAALFCLNMTAQVVKNGEKEYKIAAATPAKDTLYLLKSEDICLSIAALWKNDSTYKFKKPVIVFTNVLPTFTATASKKRKT